MAQAAAGDNDCVAIPEIDGRHVGGENLLGLRVIGAAATLIGALPGLAEQVV